MNVIKDLLIDSLNGFSLNDIPLYMFQLIAAAILAHLMEIVINKKLGKKIISNSALIAVSIAVLTSIVKYSLPFSVLAVGVMLLFKSNNKEEYQFPKIALLMISIIGLGCGVGSVAQTIVGAVFSALIILFIPIEKSE